MLQENEVLRVSLGIAWHRFHNAKQKQTLFAVYSEGSKKKKRSIHIGVPEEGAEYTSLRVTKGVNMVRNFFQMSVLIHFPLVSFPSAAHHKARQFPLPHRRRCESFVGSSTQPNATTFWLVSL